MHYLSLQFSRAGENPIGQNLTYLRENFAEDWNSRPQPLDPVDGTPGPFVTGLKSLVAFFAVVIPDLKLERMLTLPCGDQVTVLSRMTGTIGRPSFCSKQNPYF